MTTGQVNRQNIGAVAAIPASVLLGNTITVTPTAASTTYSLPTASDILTAFGKDITTGVPKLTTGDSLPLRFVNKGVHNAFIACSTTGGDGTAVIAYAPGTNPLAFASASGATAHVGKVTDLFLEFTNVSGGVGGATGSYTIYSH